MCPTGTTSSSKAIHHKSTLRSAFDILDVDGDGKISYDDLRVSYGGFSGLATEEDVIGSMISIADDNKNGYVEYDEFEKVLNGRKATKKANTTSVMEDAFKVMDKDGDGIVGHEDLKTYLNSAGFEARDEDVKAMIKLGGGDQNGGGGGGVTFQGFLNILAF